LKTSNSFVVTLRDGHVSSKFVASVANNRNNIQYFTGLFS